MEISKNISQLLVLSCLLLSPSVFALFKESSTKIVKEINRKGPYIALISGSSTVEEAFFSTNEFKPDSERPYVDLSGRRFRVGEAQRKRVIYVKSGSGQANAAAATQLLVSLFDVEGIVHFGIAGSTNNSLNIGDVVIPRQFVNTGLWEWLNPEDTVSSFDIAELDIKEFNVPREGSNSLGRFGYYPEDFYTSAGDSNLHEQIVWFNVSSKWLKVASKLEGLKLGQCINASFCLQNEPKVVVGLKGSASNIYVVNAAYRDFLFQTFGVSSADMESTAVVMTSLSNGCPAIVIRGLSNLAGAEAGGESVFASVAAANVAQTVLKFVYLLDKLGVPESLIRMYE